MVINHLVIVEIIGVSMIYTVCGGYAEAL